MGRRGRDTQRGMDMWDRLSHTHVWWIKIRRDTLGVRDRSPTPDHPAQGSSAGKINPHNFWLWKPVGVGVAEETAGFSGVSSDRAHNGLRAYTGSLPLGFSTRAPAGIAPVANGEKLKWLTSGQVLGYSFLLDRTSEARQCHCPLSELSLTQRHRMVTWVAPPWWLPKGLPQTTNSVLLYSRPCFLKTGNQSSFT